MHFDKPSQEKPCTQPTVKKLLEQKRKRETPSCSRRSLAPTNYTLSAGEPSTHSGGSNVPSDMAVSSQLWTPAEETFFSFPTSPPGPSYTCPYSLPVSPEYRHFQNFADTQPYESLVTDSSVSLSWSLEPSHSSAPTFGSPLDSNKLLNARMFINGMDYSRMAAQDEDGDTILHIYSAKGVREYAYAAAERLRSINKLDAKEHKGKTALLVAVAANQPEIVHDLLSLGADMNACDVNGQTALHLASQYGYSVVLQASLLNANPANLEARNFEGMTPLHCAALSHCDAMKAGYAGGSSEVKDHLLCVQMLLSAGASLLSQEIKSNKTVLHLAVKEGNLDLVRFLLHLPQADKDFANMKAHGNTALHMAAGLHASPHQKEMMQLLLSRGSDPSLRNLENEQAAHLLQGGAEGEQLRLLLKRRSTLSRRRAFSSHDSF